MNAPNFQYLEPWIQESSTTFIEELYKDLSKDHILFGEEFEVVARRFDKDEVLFRFKSLPTKYVQVHLTWRKEPEVAPQWPVSQIYNSFEEWVNTVMKINHNEFEG